MPSYGFLATTKLDADNIAEHLKANRLVGVPYSDEMIDNALGDLRAQADPESDDVDGMKSRYSKAASRYFDGNKNELSEMDALVAYMQMLGTLVDFSLYKAEDNLR